VLLAALSIAAFTFTAAGPSDDASAVADELIAQEPIARPNPQAAAATAVGCLRPRGRAVRGERNVANETYTRLRAARDGQPGAQLERAIEHFRQARATAYLDEAESLIAASA